MAASSSCTTLEDLEKYRIPIPKSALRGEPKETSPGKDGFFYLPNFVSQEEEAYLIEKINTAPIPKWKNLQHRRLQYWGGQVSARNTLIAEPMPSWMESYPPLVERIAQTQAFVNTAHQQPNHCLVNEYHPGQGIMPHEDGPAYCPVVATISLGSHTLLDVYRWAEESQPPNGSIAESATTEEPAEPASKVRARERDPIFSLVQEPRSLLVTVGSAYNDFLHGIADRSTDESIHLERVANVHQIDDAGLKAKVVSAMRRESQGDVMCKRDSRLSMTFRDVQKVSKGLTSLLNRR